MCARYFRVPRQDHAYLTCIMESYEGIATVSTVDGAAGIIRICAPPGRAVELTELLAALSREIALDETTPPETMTEQH
ncbi:DUF4911 domain-containing protein [Trichlorobacter ammonificans]|uniref:DUF4911 domain-containing protein n=1 Tax=Trichlorobacter ammonificans TaxID=2916410 RepID=A0ABN8HN92_9BACT|nr:DUF4911 domain-containing protein [Trichlorobacter ammonificans]CAH2032443.1 conserved protein of unknown function [Trichlorobacter ammonificans]